MAFDAMKYKWRKTNFPHCPPEDAAPFDGYLFRATYTIKPDANDFMLWADEPKNQGNTNGRCSECAVSMFDSVEAIKRKTALFGFAKRKCIAKLKIMNHHGVVLMNNGHVNVWPDNKADLVAAVTEVIEVVN